MKQSGKVYIYMVKFFWGEMSFVNNFNFYISSIIVHNIANKVY